MKQMNYQNNEVNKQLKELTKKTLPYLDKLLLELVKKYNLENPLIEKIEEDYDTYVITIFNLKPTTRTIFVTLDLDQENIVSVKIKGKNYEDFFLVDEDILSLYKTIYFFKENHLEKYYTVKGSDKIVVSIDDENYFSYLYHYKNPYLNCKITLSLKTTLLISQTKIIKNLLESSIEIQDITSIFETIKKIIGESYQEFSIKIINKTSSGKTEILDIQNGVLVEYKRYIETKDNYHEYHFKDNTLYETVKKVPSSVDEVNKVMKLLNGGNK